MNKIIYFFLAYTVNGLSIQNFAIAMEGRRSNQSHQDFKYDDPIDKKARSQNYISNKGKASFATSDHSDKISLGHLPNTQNLNQRKRLRSDRTYASLKEYLLEAESSTINAQDEKVLETAHQASLRNLKEEGLLFKQPSRYKD